MRDAREPQREDEAALGFPAAAAWPVEPIQAWCNSHKQMSAREPTGRVGRPQASRKPDGQYSQLEFIRQETPSKTTEPR